MSKDNIIKFSLPTRTVKANDFIKETNELVVEILKYKVDQNDEGVEKAKDQLNKLVDANGKLIQPMAQLPESDVEFEILIDPIKSVFESVAKIQDENRETWIMWRDESESFPTGHQWVRQYFWALNSLIPSCSIVGENETWEDVFSGEFDLRAQYLDDLIAIVVLYFRQKRFFGVLKSGG